MKTAKEYIEKMQSDKEFAAQMSEKAKALLSRRDVTISQAGEEAGFVSSSHFSHIFKTASFCEPKSRITAHLERV